MQELQKSTGILNKPEACRRFPSVRPFLGMPIDLMHLLFENVAPLQVRIWEGSIDTKGEHANLGEPRVLRRFDEILFASGTGIVDSIRAPRGLKQRGLWKADEWRTFVLITSLGALAPFLPDPVLHGWWKFCRLCEIAMRPVLREEDLEEIDNLVQSFYDHYCKTYYQGRKDRLHLMKYVIQLLLHIGLSTRNCGPLVCLSLSFLPNGTLVLSRDQPMRRTNMLRVCR